MSVRKPDDPLVVAPTQQFGMHWAREHPERFSRRPRVASTPDVGRGYRGRVVVVQGDSGGVPGRGVHLREEMVEEVRRGRVLGLWQVEEKWLP